MTTTEPGRREAALRAYYEAIEAANRANAEVEGQREAVRTLELFLARAREKLAVLAADAVEARMNEDFANSYAQEVQ